MDDDSSRCPPPRRCAGHQVNGRRWFTVSSGRNWRDIYSGLVLLSPLGISPAEDLLAATVYWWTPEIVVPAIGYWEVLIGVTFLIPALTRVAIFLLAFQMPGTFLPLVLLPEVCWDDFPLGLTLEGQYIVKNLIIIGAALVIGSRVSGLRATKREALNTTRSLTVPIP